MSYFKLNPKVEKNNFLLIAVLFWVVTILCVLIAIYVFYQIALTQKLTDLTYIRQDQVRLFNIMINDLQSIERDSENKQLLKDDKGLTTRIIQEINSQVGSDLNHYNGLGRTGEWVIARHEGSKIKFLLRSGNEFTDKMDTVDYDSKRGKPVQRALDNQTGSMVGLDYRGNQVLAAYQPLPMLNLGLVVKVDLDEFREPYIYASIIIFGFCLFVFFVGSYIFYRMARPVLHHLKSREREFDELVESIAEWVWDLDINGNIVHGSRKVQDILGYTADELVDVSLYKLLKDNEIEKVREAFEYSKKFHLNISALECVLEDNKGEEINMELSMLVLTAPNGSILGYRAVGHDITERKTNEYELRRYQENLEKMVDNRTHELEKVNEELRNFAYIVSHDLRSPLVSIIGFAGELDEDLALISENRMVTEPVQQSPDDEIRNALEERIPESLYFIKTAAEKMNRLVNSILELSRIGRRELVFEDVNLQEIIDDTLQTLAFQVEEKKVKVTVSGMPSLNTDRLAMELIFGNLLGNALKYLSTDQGGKISVSAKKEGKNMLFLVEDNGCGISPEDVPVIFELFKRVGNQNVVGEGMGLTYVRTIVRRLGGQIACKSGTGQGTRFEFTIPNMPLYTYQ